MPTSTAFPPPPKHLTSELVDILLKRGGFFLLQGEHRETTVQLFHTVVSRFTRHCEYAQQYLYTDRPRTIEFGIICNSSLNAFAYTTPPGALNEFDFIGINVGVMFTLSNIFGRMLAHPDIFPEVGSPEMESRTVHQMGPLTTDAIRSGAALVGPRCPVRSIFAGELGKAALDFLFFHELTHLRNGHLEFVRNHLSLNHWPEAFDNGNLVEDRMTRQTLEFDADSGAVLHSLNSAFHMKDNLASPAKAVPPDILSAALSAYSNAKCATKTVSFATYILFRIFDPPEWLWHIQPQKTHPLPPIRMFLLGPALFEIFHQRPEYGYDANTFAKDYSECILHAEVACGLIRGEQPDMRGIHSVIKDEEYKYLTYIKQLKEQWKVIRPTLEKYKRGGRLSP